MNQWYFRAFSIQTSNTCFICDTPLHPSVLTLNFFLRYELPFVLFGLFSPFFYLIIGLDEKEFSYIPSFRFCLGLLLKVVDISYSTYVDVYVITSKHSTAVFLFKSCQTLGNVRPKCVTVFTENCVEKWQSGHDCFTWGKKWTRCGPSHSWKSSRLIRRHLRLQKADSSSLRHKQWGHHDRAFISGSSWAGQQRDSSW